jgi:hypothetical protein
VFGNPFRPGFFRLYPNWRTQNVTGIARRIYDEYDYSALPILADAIEEAGCDNTYLLEHCRSNAMHVRGCWVVDRVLGK